MHQRSDRSGANESSWCCQSKRQLTHQGTFLRKWIDAKLMTNQVCYVNSAFRWKKEKLLCFSFYLNNISQIWPNSGLFKGISLIKSETRDRLIFHHIFNWTNLSALRSTESSNVDSSSRLQLFAKQSKKNELTFYELEMAFLTLVRQETGTTANIDDVSISLEKDKWIRIQMCAPLAFGDQAMEQYFQTCKSYDLRLLF